MKEDKERDPMPPPDATPEEIGEFWDTHSLADYWDETHEVEFQVNLKSEQDQTQFDETKSDLPSTTDEAVNPALDAATELVLDSTIPAPIRRNVFKALDRLGSALIDIPVGALERRSAEKRSESEARIKITEAVNAQIVQQIKVDPEFPQRASNTFAKKILREQFNLEKTLGFATDILKRKKYDNSANQQADPETEQSIDDDWFNIFEKEASQKSSKDMQLRFGRVLAGEIEKPGSYSIKAVKLLGELDQNTAALFKSLCSACVVLERHYDQHILDIRVSSLGGNAGQNVLGKYGLGFDQLNILNEYNLIISDYNSQFPYYSSIVDERSMGSPFWHQGRYWILEPLPKWDRSQWLQFKLSGVAFSRVGRELFYIVDQDPLPKYTQELNNFFSKQNLAMVEVSINRFGNGTWNYSIVNRTDL